MSGLCRAYNDAMEGHQCHGEQGHEGLHWVEFDDGISEWGDNDELWEEIDRLRALLSQPTPTAVLTGGIGYPVQEAARREDERTRRLATATPPRIEDMAPGTTFTSTVSAGNTLPLRFMRTTDGIVDQDGTLWPAEGIDPSTIRDVTPPMNPTRRH